MVILHAAAGEGVPLIWAEASPTPTRRSPGRSAAAERPLSRSGAAARPSRERRPGGAAVPARPGRPAVRSRVVVREIPRSRFDAGAALLADLLPSASAGEPRRIEDVVLWLPTRDGEVMASSPLLADPSTDASAVTLAPWRVSACRLPTGALIDLLVEANRASRVLVPGVVIGADLAYWARAMHFAAALTARERFLPALTRDADGFRARWEPVIAGDDRDRLRELAIAMPDACRALARDDGDDGPPSTRPTAALSSFIGDIVDHLARDVDGAATARGAARTGTWRSAASAHDRWLAALASPDARVEGSPDELSALASQLGEWRRRLTAVDSAPFTLCLRLEEPADGSDGWSVQYLLQSVEEPSLMVSADDVWRSSRRSAALAHGGPDPRTYLLQSLGQAAAICPQVEASLSAREPVGYALDTAGAHAFLAEHAWTLSDAGFRVVLPAWWTRKGKRTGLSVRARVATPPMVAVTGLSLDALVTVDWDIMLGGTRITRAELEALARLQAPLVRVRGQWVEVTAEDRQHALRLLKGSTTRMAARDVVRMAFGAAAPPGDLPLHGLDAEGWLGEIVTRLEQRDAFEELPMPAGFVGQLRPYQARGYSWLAFMTRWGLGACLADDMGLGKTIQTLALVQRGWTESGRPTLLICPTSVVGNWQKEAARFTPDLPVLVHHGLGRTHGDAFARDAARHALVVSSYALLHRDAAALGAIEWHGVVLDEAQNIKNAETRQAQAARALRASHRVALTGTPVENNVGDLWSILEFLNHGLLGTAAEFKRQFFVPIQVNRDADATARLKRTTGAFVLRRLKTDRTILADLPDKLEMKVFCTLTREQASLYAAVVRDAEQALTAAEGIQRKGVVLATLSKLKQVCNHPAQFLGDGSGIAGRSGKLARLTEMLDEAIAANERTLIFTQFAEMGALIKTHLQETFGREVLFLHGGVPKAQRDRMVERFQSASDEAPPVFVLSLKAGGTGLTLTAARHVFLFDRWWNPAVEAQAIDRAHRIGQTRHVQVHKFVCLGTLEERIDELIERKKQLAADIVGTGEAWLTELSTTELKQIFALRAEAVAE